MKPPPDEQDPFREGAEVQEVGAVDEVLATGEVQRAEAAPPWR